MSKSFASVLGAALICCQCGIGYAAPRTVTLDVAGMTCAACPFTVKKALTRVEGVTRAEVSFDKQQATVSYDDAKTNMQALIKATTDAGYPSSVGK